MPAIENATQTVFGEPFVGPAGRLLARALDEAGIDLRLRYETNAVKHFKFTRKGGNRRIHQKPSRTEVVACRPWLIAEIEAVRPQVIVCLGATAAQSLLGAAFRVSTQRGQALPLPSSAGVDLRPGRSWWPRCIRRRYCATAATGMTRPTDCSSMTCAPRVPGSPLSSSCSARL